MYKFNGMTAAICGGSKGIGLECGKLFCKYGANVVVLARTKGDMADLDAEFIECDFENPKLVEQAALELSKLNVSILINNSGGPPVNNCLNISHEEILAGINSHLYSSQKLVESVVGNMKNAKQGRIINIISISALMPVQDLAVSNFIRSGMIGWAKNLSTILAADGITVNSILPGWTKTKRLDQIMKARSEASSRSIFDCENDVLSNIPMKRFAKPQEIAQLAAFLASENAAYITGQKIAVDGGIIPCI